MRTLPFDLEKAKAGHPLVTRDGRPAKFCFCAEDWSPNSRVFVQIDGRTSQRAVAGRRYPNIESPDDVFLLAPEPKLRPWTEDEVPAEAWFSPSDKLPRGSWAFRATRFDESSGALFLGGDWVAPQDLLDQAWHHSQTAHGPWLLCGVLE